MQLRAEKVCTYYQSQRVLSKPSFTPKQTHQLFVKNELSRKDCFKKHSNVSVRESTAPKALTTVLRFCTTSAAVTRTYTQLSSNL